MVGIGIRVPVHDNGTQESKDKMAEFLPDVIEIIEAQLGHGNRVVVHCLAAQQRSPAVIAAYLMKNMKLTLDEAVKYIQYWSCQLDGSSPIIAPMSINRVDGSVTVKPAPVSAR